MLLSFGDLIMLSRRQALGSLGAAAASAALLSARPAVAQNVTPAELAMPGPLGDSWLGPESAKVTIVEYASLTCSHCAHFHKTTFPEMKKRYVETGQVRFALREFPLDPLATAGFMLARADGGAKYYPITDLLFETQQSWAFTNKPLDALAQTMRQAGFSQEKFESVLRDQKLYDAVNAVKNRAVERFKVESTPTFFVNGQRVPGAVSIDELEKIIKPMLGA
jgi:protein-disulfide isomerase